MVALAASLAVVALVGCLGTKITDPGFIGLGSKEFDLACLGFISRMDGVHVGNHSNNFHFNSFCLHFLPGRQTGKSIERSC